MLKHWGHPLSSPLCVNLLSFDSFLLSVQFGGGQSKPESTVDLRGGSVDWASKDKSSKKHVIEVGQSSNFFSLYPWQNDKDSLHDWWLELCIWCLFWLQVKTRQGTELLIQSENDSLINEWYRALQDTISTHVRMNTFTKSQNVSNHKTHCEN